MLVTLKEVLNYAMENKCAVGSFNTPTLENIQATLNAAEKLNVPVILMHAEIHEEYAPLEVIGPIMIQMAKASKLKVCVFLDHGTSIDYIKRALEIGFTGVMYDGSALPYEENLKNTKICGELAKKYGANLEAEIGVIGGREAGSKEKDATKMYTNPEDALRFVREANCIDALACSFGTAHGIYRSQPKLDFERITKIAELTKLPLVMNGGSGVSKESYLKAIDCGIRKINYYSYAGKAGVDATVEFVLTNPTFYHEIAFNATKAMEENILEALKTFNRIKEIAYF